MSERALLIIVPTWVESELWERRWAYRLVQRLREHGFWGVVVTDKYLLEESRDSHGRVLLDFIKRNRTPIISIGGPVSNTFTRMIEEEVLQSREKYGELWLARGNIAIVEWEGVPVTVVWGAVLQDTISRLKVFMARHLDDFVNIVRRLKSGKEERKVTLKELLDELSSDSPE